MTKKTNVETHVVTSETVWYRPSRFAMFGLVMVGHMYALPAQAEVPKAKAWVLADRSAQCAPYEALQPYSFNSVGERNYISRQRDPTGGCTPGTYIVSFEKIGTAIGAKRGVVHVSAFGGNHYCKVAYWGGSQDLKVWVNRFSAAGRLVNGQFTALFYKDNQERSGSRNAHLLAGHPHTGYSWNSVGLPNTVRRLATGRYEVMLGGMRKGFPLVTAYGKDSRRCKISSWNRDSAHDATIEVLCLNAMGDDADSMFTLSYRSDFDFGLPRPEQPAHYGAYVMIDPNGSIYARDTNTGAAVSVRRTGTGLYEILWNRFGHRYDITPDTAVITDSYKKTPEYCAIKQWKDISTPSQVIVMCFDQRGTPKNGGFGLLFLTGVPIQR